MQNDNVVYIITNDINKLVYIGVANDLRRRMYQHSIAHDREKSPIDKAIYKYGWNHFKYEVLDTYSSQIEREEKEKYYIAKYDSYRHGYNATKGGDSITNPDVKGSKNPRAQLNEEDVARIRERRMNGERMSDVYEDYKYKLRGNARAGFSAVWLHKSWINIHSEFIGKYPKINSKDYATKKKNLLTKEDEEKLTRFFMYYGPVKYNIPYPNYKDKIDWQSFYSLCGKIVEELYGNKNTRTYRKKNGTLDKMILNYRSQLK